MADQTSTEGLNSLDQAILEQMKAKNNIITDKELIEELEVNDAAIIQSINTLITANAVKPFTTDSLGTMFIANDEIVRGLGDDEVKIYGLIKHSKTMGITARELSNQSSVKTPNVNKATKKLEQKNYIKSVKSIQSKKKLWFAYDVEPAAEIKGDIWYINNEFNEEFIEALCSKCFDYISKNGVARKKEISTYLRSSGLSSSDLQEHHVEKIINCLIFDDKIEEIEIDKFSNNPQYREAKWNVPNMMFTNVPCSNCAVRNECTLTGVINPTDCKYLNEWLDF